MNPIKIIFYAVGTIFVCLVILGVIIQMAQLLMP